MLKTGVFVCCGNCGYVHRVEFTQLTGVDYMCPGCECQVVSEIPEWLKDHILIAAINPLIGRDEWRRYYLN